jgi:hypothetical protein
MNSLEARLKEAAGRGATTNVGREFNGLVNASEAREVSGVNSATDLGEGGGGGNALGAGPPGGPGGPGGLRRTGVRQTDQKMKCYCLVPFRTSDAFARGTVLSREAV